MSEDKTIKRSIDESQIVSNPLFKYATYNTIFTLSAMNQAELENPDELLTGSAHDIIIRSGGIGDPRATNGLSPENKSTLSPLGKDSLVDAQANLARGRDLYFSKVELQNLPTLNEKRRMTSVTAVEMVIEEPMGISLLDRLRGAAANCNYLDHISAPYLLTMEFRGFDEFGNTISTEQQQALKRKIPIKITQMTIDVNKGGTTYNVRAIPYNEHGFLNHHIYLRTAGQILAGENIQASMDNLTALLNKQTEDERKEQYVEFSDTYEIVVHDEFKNEKPMPGNLGMSDIAVTAKSPAPSTGTGPSYQDKILRDEIKRKAGTVKQGDNILTIISELMKSLPRFQDEGSLDKFIAKTGSKTGEMYFNFFMIESSVVPDSTRFDRLRGKHPRKILYHVVPYQVHAYSLAAPGTSTGKNFDPFVKKAYNYIFTGDNVDILDLNISYKVAYFASKLKDIEGKQSGEKLVKENAKPITVKKINPDSVNVFSEPPFIRQSEVSVSKTVTSGILKGPSTALDERLDALSNPKADMVQVQMTILGDPSYLGQSQFIPTTAKRDVLAENQQTLSFSQGTRTIWNEIYGNYNMGFGDTVIKLNFRSPADIDNATGVYEINDQEQIAFSGFYRVIKVNSTFQDGKFTQMLELVRFNNQGAKPLVPVETSYVKQSIFDHRPGMLGDGLVSLSDYNDITAEIRESFRGGLNGIAKRAADTVVNKLKSKFNIGRDVSP